MYCRDAESDAKNGVRAHITPDPDTPAPEQDPLEQVSVAVQNRPSLQGLASGSGAVTSDRIVSVTSGSSGVRPAISSSPTVGPSPRCTS